MATIQNNFNYLSVDGIPWVALAWIGLIILRPFATFVHEIGHALSALFFTKEKVFIRVGDDEKGWKGEISRISWQFSFKKGNEGFTGYDKHSLSIISLASVILGGPCTSFCMAYLMGWLIFHHSLPIWIEVISVSWFCANALVFTRSIIPVKLKSTRCFPQGPPSDGLELKKIFFKK